MSDQIVWIYDCGYRGRPVKVGRINLENKTFMKDLDYLNHFMHKFQGYGYSEYVINQLEMYRCERLIHFVRYRYDEEFINKMRDKGITVVFDREDDGLTQVWITEFQNYLNPGIYQERVDTLTRRNNQPDRRVEDPGKLFNDRQRFVHIDNWRRLR